jgi:hypothetical protein
MEKNKLLLHHKVRIKTRLGVDKEFKEYGGVQMKVEGKIITEKGEEFLELDIDIIDKYTLTAADIKRIKDA